MSINLQGLSIGNSFMDIFIHLGLFGGMQGRIDNGKISVAKGVTSTDITLAYGKTGQTLAMKGNVILAGEKLDHFNMVVGSGLLNLLHLNIPNVVQFAPQGVIVPLEGSLSNPHADILKAVTETLGKNLIPNLIPGLLSGQKH
jgi:hypothetical protein